MCTEAVAFAQAIVEGMKELDKHQHNIPTPPTHAVKIAVKIFSDCRSLIEGVQKRKFAESYEQESLLSIEERTLSIGKSQ